MHKYVKSKAKLNCKRQQHQIARILMDPNLSILFPPLKIDNKRMIDALSKGEKSEWLMRWGILPFVTLFKSMNELARHNGA